MTTVSASETRTVLSITASEDGMTADSTSQKGFVHFEIVVYNIGVVL